jgi:hypothetical protein
MAVMKSPLLIATLLLAPLLSAAEQPSEEIASNQGADDAIAIAAATEAATTPNGDGIESPKTMSGMSILGNEEAPKALVIVPWKSSELGEAISLTDTLDDRARPVDKDVFLRELRFYEIRSGE